MEFEKGRVILFSVSVTGTTFGWALEALPLLCASNGVECRDGMGGGCLLLAGGLPLTGDAVGTRTVDLCCNTGDPPIDGSTCWLILTADKELLEATEDPRGTTAGVVGDLTGPVGEAPDGTEGRASCSYSEGVLGSGEGFAPPLPEGKWKVPVVLAACSGVLE